MDAIEIVVATGPHYHRLGLGRLERCRRMAGYYGRAIGVLMLLAILVGSLFAPVAAGQTPGRVTFTMPAFCEMSSAYTSTVPRRIQSLSSYQNFSGPMTRVPSFTSDGQTLTWTVSLAPGLYFYDFYGWAAREPMGEPRGFCSSGNQQIVVLPGDAKQVALDPRYSKAMIDDIYRPLVAYGVANPALHLRLIGFSGSPHCGTRVSNIPYTPIKMDRDSVGYWSVDLNETSSAVKPVFALGIQHGSQTWYLRFVSNDMAIFYHALPGSVRFDLTPSRLQTALASPPETLLCL